MPLVELFAPKGSLDGDRRGKVTGQLVGEVMAAEGAPDTPAARSISWLVVHEVDTWFVGGSEVTDTQPPPFLVRVSVPAASMDDDKRADMIDRITRVLADGDDDPQRFYRDPSAWVHIIEIAEGNWGAFGKVVRLPDIVGYVTGAAVS